MKMRKTWISFRRSKKDAKTTFVSAILLFIFSLLQPCDCSVRNTIGESSPSVYKWDEDGSVIVDIPVHYLDMQQTNFVGRQGSQVTMPCTDSNTDKISDKDTIVVWKFGKNWDVALELGFRLYGVATIKEVWESRASIDKDTFALNLEELDGEADSGNYFCKVFDANDDSLFKRTLTVEVPAKIVSWSGADTFLPLLGSSLELHCEASGVPDPIITWHKAPTDNMIIARGSEFLLDNVSKTDRGLYTCKADNMIGPGDQRHMTVDVLYPPDFLDAPVVNQRSYDGRSTKFTCLVKGRPIPEVTWTKAYVFRELDFEIEEVVNDESTFNYSSSSLPTSPPRKTAKEKHSGSPSHPGGSGGSFVIRTEKRDSETVLSVLAIRSVTERSFGLYRCKARSPVGYAEKDYTLSGVADAPKIISPITSGRSYEYTLAWKTPSIPVNRYIIRMRKRPDPNQIPETQSERRQITTMEYSNNSSSSSDANSISVSTKSSDESSSRDESSEWVEQVVYVGERTTITVSYVIKDLDSDSVYDVQLMGSNKYGIGDMTTIQVHTTSMDHHRRTHGLLNSAMKVSVSRGGDSSSSSSSSSSVDLNISHTLTSYLRSTTTLCALTILPKLLTHH
ncbi:hemicentin-2-like [Symsagittifera roscoffensis]|uniref:hemicentin-2-like n=1 Tax=Symsagittifera roscoffensis TaxID=84072 RepID=UPI00307B1B90